MVHRSRPVIARLSVSRFIIPALCFANLSFAGEPQPAPTPQPPRPALGTNLSGVNDWNSELPFVDVFRSSRRWLSQAPGMTFGAGPALTRWTRGGG